MKQHTSIEIAGKRANVYVRSVGQCFGTYAFALVAGKRYESDVVALGFSGVAIRQVVDRVQHDYPAAVAIDPDGVKIS